MKGLCVGTANVNIKIVGSYNGRAVERALQGLEKLNAQSAIAGTGAARNLAQIGTSMLEQGAAIENAGYKAEQFGERWLGVTAAVVAVSAATAAAAISIDTSLTNVKKTVDGTEEQYQGLKEAAIEFSKTNAVSASQILDVQALGAQLGFTIDELDEFSRVVSGLDIATNMDAETAATEMAQFANITKMAHSEVSNYGSAIVDLGNNYATTEKDISSMAMRLAASGTQVGMSQADILGLATALTSMGMEAEAGGSAMSTIMARIDKDVAQSSDSLETWASTAQMSASEFSEAWKNDPVAALSAVISGLDSATQSGGNMSLMLEELGITELRQTDAMKRLAGNSEFLASAVDTANAAWEENSALQAEVDNRNASLASRIEILQNRVIAIAEEIGTPLVNALLDALEAGEPLLQFVGDAASAFADMDEGQQKVILGLVGAAAAFPPLMIAGGKYLQLVGSTTKAIGAKQRAMGSLINLTRTDNAELLRRVATEGTFAQRLAVSANQTAKTSSQIEKATESTKKGTKAAKESATAATATASATAAAGTSAKSTSKAVDTQTIAMKAGSGAAKAFGTALKTVAPLAVISGIIAVATAVGDLVEQQKQYEKATDGLTGATSAMLDSFNGARVSVSSFGGETESATGNVGNLGAEIDAMIQRNAELADSISSIYSEAGNTLGMVQNYRDVIEELGGKSSLTAEEAAKLQIALDGVNEQCGTSYQVAGSAEEGYRMMADGASVARDEILNLIDAQKNQIRLEAAGEAYAEALKGITDSANAAAAAQSNYESTVAEYNRLIEEAANGTMGAAEAASGMAWQVTDAKNKMDQANATYEAQKAALGGLEDAQTLYQMAIDAGNGSIAEAVANNDSLTAAFNAAGKSTVSLVDSLGALGVSTQTLSTLTMEETTKLAQAYDGTAASVSAALFSMATDASSQGANAGKWLTENFSAEAQGAVNAATNVTGLTTAQFKLLADSAGASGEDAIVALANSITANAGLSTNAASIVKQALILEFTNGDVEAAVKILGADIDQGLADGITGNASMPAEAIGLMSQQTIDNAKTAFESHSPSQVMHQLGIDVDTGLANGITAGQDQPITAMGSLAQMAIAAISGMPGDANTTGTSASSLLASGLGSGVGSVFSNASALLSSAKQGISGAPSAYSGTGSQAASRFSGAIGSGSAYSSGRSLANSGKSGMESVSAYGAGSNFVRSFGSGMSGVSIWSVAYNVGMSALGAIKSALGIASPSKEGIAVGEYFDLGIIRGMEKKESDVAAQARSLERAMNVSPPEASFTKTYIPLYENAGGYGAQRRSGAVGQTVNNYYSFGNITMNAQDAAGVETVQDVFAVLARAARMNPDRR